MKSDRPVKDAPVHLVCNAHLDPVWLWEWEEGAAEAMSTFRVAADCCDEFPGFVFNHNESILYRWVEEFEPELFRRIQRLVREGRWHIMGGWHLQPDCNMPSGESFVRQILIGREYFQGKFGKRPTTAINFDPFGHTRGLVQILAKCGYDSYVFCRPNCPLPADTFLWEGYDGSKIMACRAGGYESIFGRAREKIMGDIGKRKDRSQPLVVLWGVGNHGGGPSRLDLRKIAGLIASEKSLTIRHSTPEGFFREAGRRRSALPVHRGDLNLWAPGCYTSQVRIKQTHRRLENELYSTEKMCSAAWLTAGMKYPESELRRASLDLATAQFHDILPGSSIQAVEGMALRVMDHALEELSRVKARSFFALAKGQPKAAAGALPILVYNPHPFPVDATVECEFRPVLQGKQEALETLQVRRGRERLPSQAEKEACNIPADWRKRVVFRCRLEPSRMNRFDCDVEETPRKPAPALRPRNGRIAFRSSDLDVVINARTGLVDHYRCGKKDFLKPGTFAPIVIKDNDDPWGMRTESFREVIGRFKLLSPEASARFSGVHAARLPAVRVIEDGPVRSVVEAVFGYGDSFLCQRYKLPKAGTEIEVEIRVYWNEKDRMLKLAVPGALKDAAYRGQVAYGADDLRSDGTECVAQKWTAIVSRRNGAALTCINDGSYGSDFADGEMRLTLLRSPGYSSHPVGDRERIRQDRFTERIDQGERLFRFWFNGGSRNERLTAVDREALAHNEKPMALSFFPSGHGVAPRPFVTVDGEVIQVTAIKKAEKGGDLVIRLFEPTGRRHTATVSIPSLRTRKSITLEPFEIRTYRVGVRTKRWTQTDLLEAGTAKA